MDTDIIHTSQSSSILPPEPELELTPDLIRKRRGQFRIIADRFLKNKVAVAGLVGLLLIVLATIFAPLLVRYDPDAINLGSFLQGSSPQHLLGTDFVGRDVFARLLYGGRVSLLVGFISMIVTVAVGLTIGALAGFYGGWLDSLLMRITDGFLSIPLYLILFVLSVVFSDGSVKSIVFLIAAFSWPTTARIVRSEFLSLKEREFLLAARTLGASDFRLMFRHILPNAIGPLVVNATLLIGGNIITESVLSYFNFGLQPPAASWGTMLYNGQSYFTDVPLLVYAPGIAILITVLCFNLIGDGLRDALDPYMTER